MQKKVAFFFFLTLGKYDVYISRSLSFVKIFLVKYEERNILVLEYVGLKSSSVSINSKKYVSFNFHP